MIDLSALIRRQSRLDGHPPVPPAPQSRVVPAEALERSRQGVPRVAQTPEHVGAAESTDGLVQAPSKSSCWRSAQLSMVSGSTALTVFAPSGVDRAPQTR